MSSKKRRDSRLLESIITSWLYIQTEKGQKLKIQEQAISLVSQSHKSNDKKYAHIQKDETRRLMLSTLPVGGAPLATSDQGPHRRIQTPLSSNHTGSYYELGEGEMQYYYYFG